MRERAHILHTSGSLALLGSLSASEDDLYSEKTHFCALRAGGAREAGFFFMDRFLLSRRFQRGITRPWEGLGSVFSSPGTQGHRDPEREKRHYQNIYIDELLGCVIVSKVIKLHASTFA